MRNIQLPDHHMKYFNTHEFIASIRGHPIKVVSKPGIASWDRIPPSTLLLAEAIKVYPSDQVLVIGCHVGALPATLARECPEGKIIAHDCDFIALQATSWTIAANQVGNVLIHEGINLNPEQYGSIDVVAMHLPKGRELARRWLVMAHRSLKPGGKLYLAGGNKEGIHSSIKDAQELFGEMNVLGYKKGCRVALAVKSQVASSIPAWAGEGGIRPDSWIEFTANIQGCQYSLRSLPGVFSARRIDEGTSLLIDTLPSMAGSSVMDIGCGYGMIGIVAAHAGASQVNMLDSNLYAVAAARENMVKIGAQAQVSASDLIPTTGINPYDFILSNPPFHTGMEVDYLVAQILISQALEALALHGKLILVANRFIRYDHLIKQVFGNVDILASTNQYHVLVGEKTRV